MADIARLARFMRELEEQLTACMRCGFCQAVCPLYAQTGLETDVARGKLALLAGLGREMIRDARGVKESLDRCLLCGSCAAACPSGTRVLDIFIKARAILAGYLGLSPAKRLIFRGVLARPALFDGVLAMAPRFQHILARPVDADLETSCARLTSPLGPRHFKRLAPEPLHNLLGPRRPDPNWDGPRVALFWGCLIDKLYPRVGLAMAEALEHRRVGLVIPRGQACCGIPALASGDADGFARMLEYNLQRFDPDEFDYLVTACATCASAMKKLWPLMGPDALPGREKRILALADKTREVSQFLAEQGMIGDAPAQPDAGAPTFTYHDPCHLKKALGAAEQPRRAATAGGRWRLVEMAEADWCCGMGGSFGLEHYDLSSRIGRRKLDNILAVGCDTVVTSCPACMAQISDALSRAGEKIRVRHAIELYAEAAAAEDGRSVGGAAAPFTERAGRVR